METESRRVGGSPHTHLWLSGATSCSSSQVRTRGSESTNVGDGGTACTRCPPAVPLAASPGHLAADCSDALRPIFSPQEQKHTFRSRFDQMALRSPPFSIWKVCFPGPFGAPRWQERRQSFRRLFLDTGCPDVLSGPHRSPESFNICFPTLVI